VAIAEKFDADISISTKNQSGTADEDK